jgi:outer membrane translocation and assembly module TamA
MLLVSGEVRIDLFKLDKQWLTLALFADGGDVTAPGGVALDNLNWAVGIGLRYDTVIGPIRVDVGYRINRVDVAGPDGLANPDPGERFAFHLSLGEAF